MDELFDNDKTIQEIESLDKDEVLDDNEIEKLEEIQVDELDDFDNDEELTKKSKCNFDDIRFDRKVGVYVKINNEGFITNISSDIFLTDLNGWVKIDEGEGDRYVYAQTQYFGSLVDEKGNYIHKIQ